MTHEDITRAPKFTLPTIFVIFGITGDLVRKKILRAIYHLYIKKLLPSKFRIYGFSRRPFDDVEARVFLKALMQEQAFPHPELYDLFLESFFYIRGDFHEETAYGSLASVLGRADGKWNVCSNKLFYLAVPPASYTSIIDNLHRTGLTVPCSPEEGWTRVILEKPFGRDLETAIKLDMQLGTLFKEEQIYRVDHYLAKETVRNILAFRFGNTFLEPAWNSRFIEKIEVRLFEKESVSRRGDFYDQVGALRDVGQNHLLQLLALFIMDRPESFNQTEIKRERSRALTLLKHITKDTVETQTFRAQYQGYTREEGVSSNSQTETYFRIKTFTSHPVFAGVPLILESGKALDRNVTEVIVTFKHPIKTLFAGDQNPRNALIYRIRPEEKISMSFLAKKPGFGFSLAAHELGFDYKEAYKHDVFVDDYEALLYDIVKGDQTLFVSTDEIISEWQFIEPIVQMWQSSKPILHNYIQNTYAFNHE